MAGWVCAYDPAAVVFHRHRDTIRGLRFQLRAYMRGHVAALLVQFGHNKAVGNLIRAFVSLPIWFALVFLSTFWRREPLRRALLPWEVFGMIEGWVTLLHHRRRGASAGRPVAQVSHKRPVAHRSAR